jgi:hypothetical protein
MRDLYDNSSNSPFTMSGVSERERCNRELQSVGAKLACAADHTSDTAKNYKSDLGGKMVWTFGTETGEIASACLVNTSSVGEIAHAAESVARRPNFTPKIAHLDTWPANESFWKMILGEALGRLGLFHFSHRMVDTLRVDHDDFKEALKKLAFALHDWDEDDFDGLVKCLKEGLMGNSRKKWTDAEIAEANMTKEQAPQRPPTAKGTQHWALSTLKGESMSPGLG